MRVTEAILARRSTRREFLDTPVAAEVIERIVASGLHAPSSKNAQPWRLHVVTNRDLAAAMADAVLACPGADDYVPTDPATGRPRADFESSVGPSAEVVRQATLNIVIENLGSFSGGRRNLVGNPANLGEALVGYTFEVIGLGAAVANMWLTATEAGLAGVFIGDVVIAEAQIKELLGIDGDLVGILAMGHSGQRDHIIKELHPDRVVYHT